jgi:hypothetical protein
MNIPCGLSSPNPILSTRPRRHPAVAVKLHTVFRLHLLLPGRQVSLRISGRFAFAASSQIVRAARDAAGARGAACLPLSSFRETICVNREAAAGHTRDSGKRGRQLGLRVGDYFSRYH